MKSDLHDRIQALQSMTTAELREEWRRVMGDEPRSYNRVWLWKRLAWAIQMREYGGLSQRAQERLEALLPHAEAWMPLGRRAFPSGNDLVPPREQERFTPGTALTRRYKGRTLELLVREDGFELDGVIYPSLSAAAQGATGSHWNGRLFWFGRDRKAG